MQIVFKRQRKSNKSLKKEEFVNEDFKENLTLIKEFELAL